MSTEKKVVLHINSKERNRGSTTDFNININNSGIAKPHSISLLSAEIPHSFYNIDQYHNKINFTVALVVDGADVVTGDFATPDILFDFNLELEKKNYTSTTLLSAIQTAINDYSNATYVVGAPGITLSTPRLPPNVFTFAYNPNNGKVTISVSQALFGEFTPNKSVYFRINSTGNIQKSLGFLPSQLDTFTKVPLVSEAILDARNISTLYLHCDACSSTNSLSSDGRPSNILKKLQITESPFSTIFYQSYDPYMERYTVSKNIDSIGFRLTNEANQVLDNNGLEWSCSILVYFE